MTSKLFEKYREPCKLCGTIKSLTRHHIKNDYGKKTGEIIILCRECHDEIEEYYKSVGLVQNYVKLSPEEKLHLKQINGKIKPYSLHGDINDMVPFHARGKKN